MGLLKKLGKGIAKIAKKNKKSLLIGARVIAAGVTRGKSEKVIGNLKSVGAAVKTYKGLTKRPNKSESAILAKAATLGTPPLVNIKAPAQTMPGGAPLRGVARLPGAARPKARKVAASKPKKAAPKRSGSGRKPPKGGLDLKALSASWKAAGKPGTWQGWIAKNK